MKKSLTNIQEREYIHDQSIHTYSVHVTPLPLDMTDKDLRFIFSLCGPITRVTVVKKKINLGICFGYVHFQTLEAKEKAKKYFDGAMLGKRCIQVTNAKCNELLPKNDNSDWDNETRYEDIQRSTSIPKKRVHTNESYDKTKNSFSSNRSKQKSFQTESKSNKSDSSHSSSRLKDKNQRKYQRKDSREYERRNKKQEERKNEKKDEQRKQRQDSFSGRSIGKLKGKKQSYQKKSSLKQTEYIDY